MQPFLHTVAQQLYATHGQQMHRLAVVFPNRRQSVFFAHYLQQVALPPCFLPAMFTIEELVAQCTSLQVADHLTQGFALYEAFATVSAEDGETNIPPFDAFFAIGETILKDFREMDNYLVDISQVCQVLYDIESIDKAFDQLTEEQRAYIRSFWTSALDKGQLQEKFLKLWERLPRMYALFMQLLQQQAYTTMGAAYRLLATDAAAAAQLQQPWDHIAFVGFNAFNKAEETFIKKWNDAGYASLWFDADAWYVNHKQQEAGDFLRRNFQVVGLTNSLPLQEAIAQRTAAIEVVAVEGQHAQAKQVSDWWQHVSQKAGIQAGILLADESLLLPVLQSLPPGMKPINITMGYPLQQSPVFSLVKLFFDAQADMATHRFQTVHHTLVNRWLQHPFSSWGQEAADNLQKRMLKDNLVQVPLSLLHKETESAILLFSRMMADMEVFPRLRQLIELALTQPAVKADSLTSGMCIAAWKTLQQLQPLFGALQPAPGLWFIGSLLMKQIGAISVPFEGEPLQGVQLMGLLESRGLDFDHLLILGANEGSLPRIKPPDSFLPDNVRRAFGMPVPEHQDAIFAYVFYRLLHRTQSVRLVYNALVTDNSTGEVSRFVQQLQFETKIPVEQRQIAQRVAPTKESVITVHKDADVMRKMWAYIKPDDPRKLSPSAINTYLTCRLQFFFRYVASLKEPEELDEAVDAAAVGKVVHRLMELLYERWQKEKGKHITVEAIDWMMEHREQWIDQAFKEAWRDKAQQETFQFSGELHVVRAVVLLYAEKLLLMDKAYAPFNVVAMETSMQAPIPFVTSQGLRTAVLGGKIDRIDEKDGLYRMVDYKTGGDDPDFKSLDGLFDQAQNDRNKAALQTLLYTWVFHKTYPDFQHFQPALMAVRNAQKKNTSKRGVEPWVLLEKAAQRPVTAQNMADILPGVEQNLQTLLTEMMDTQQPFGQTADTTACTYCDFCTICGR